MGAVFLLQWIVPLMGGPNLVSLFGMTPARVTANGWLWQPLTYLFLHGGPVASSVQSLHVVGPGPGGGRAMGAGPFLFYFFLCGVGAAVFNLVFEPGSLSPVVGASGAIYGLLVAFAMMYPEAVFLVMFLVPLKAKHAVIFFAVIELMFSTSANQSHVANLAHLGGLVTGYLYLKSRTWRYSSRSLIGRVTDWAKKKTAPKPPVPLHELGQEVDRILEKISQKGRSSLTRSEQDLLDRYSRLKR
jgi:membrane associated rhomboid family serine protease